jgi:hypothetical protein
MRKLQRLAYDMSDLTPRTLIVIRNIDGFGDGYPEIGIIFRGRGHLFRLRGRGVGEYHEYVSALHFTQFGIQHPSTQSHSEIGGWTEFCI